VLSKTKFLNFFRKLSQFSFIENILAHQIIGGNNFARKLIADNKMYPTGSYRVCTRDGINYQLDISDYMDHSIFFGIIDTVDFDRRMLYSQIKEDFTCFDVGANIGETTINFARLAPKGTIYSFEPVPFLFERLKTNTALNKFSNILLFNLALSDKKEALYFETPQNKNSSGITLKKEKSTTTTMVNSTTIDFFIEENKIEKVDFIKIDVEGFEHYVLNGAKNTLQNMKPTLMVEIDNRYLISKNTSEKMLLSLLQNTFGYTLYRINGLEKIKINVIEETDMHYDVLCVAE
jgi:FkbM family methyltransferase